MGFVKLVRSINTSKYHLNDINVFDIKAQYNPERFHFWKSLHKGPDEEVLNMLFSPHYRFLMNREDTAYYQLQRFYGRNNKWIKNKINKFLDTFESIKKNGFNGEIMIVNKPLVDNRYNNGFEIFEGHHRVACCLVLGIKKIPCMIIRR